MSDWGGEGVGGEREEATIRRPSLNMYHLIKVREHECGCVRGGDNDGDGDSDK